MTTILIAEDESAFREALAAYLRDRGFDVSCAADGEEALRVLREKCVDLVILDLMMPKVSGRDVLKQMRSDPKLRTLPVIVATAVEKPSLQDELRPMVQAWLLKSNASLGHLVEMIRRLLPPKK